MLIIMTPQIIELTSSLRDSKIITDDFNRTEYCKQ